MSELVRSTAQRIIDYRDGLANARVFPDGTCWLGGTTWRGRRQLRISVSNASTTEADVDSSVAAIRAAAAGAGEG